jgi:hypothetical protein
MPKEKGAYVHDYPRGSANEQGSSSSKGAKVLQGIAVKLGLAKQADYEPARKPLKNTAPKDDPRQV